jgi:hypothetical protein
MKGTLTFDPEDQDYGPASPHIRAVIRAFADIDWFEPWGDVHAAQVAFEEHQQLAHAHQPELFPAAPRIAHLEGTWVEFGECCTVVRNSDLKWDWRMTALKQLSYRHARDHGWRLADQPAPAVPRPGELFMRIGGGTIWNYFTPPMPTTSAGKHEEPASFYTAYARNDLYDAIQWWLARPTAIDNPFVPLIRCYQLGVYPFSLAKDHVVLFAFRAAAAKLPTARLVR